MEKKRIITYVGAGAFLCAVLLAFVAFSGRNGILGSDKPNPVFFEREGITAQYLYEGGVLVGMEVYEYIRNEGRTGNVTIKGEIQCVDDGRTVREFTRILYVEADESTMVKGLVTFADLMECGWRQYTQVPFDPLKPPWEQPPLSPPPDPSGFAGIVFEAWASG